ncbi:MAG TPA: insulinase family protein [Candidatus Kapabacteria bacterium]|nr:insulinase family protein [Candidatus Kapabacteria bacterium]
MMPSRIPARSTARLIGLVLCLALAPAGGPLSAQSPTQRPRAELSPTSGQPLPLDSAVRVGRLPNGLTYYVRENREPNARAELRLVVKAGSILEEPDQQGLAHFVEHMAFNGTRRFERHEIVRYLESIGMRFGPDLNAYTSFDQTVYMLQLPTDSSGVLAKGLDILSEWAGGIAFDSLEIERERGVVIEEWRGGRGAEARIRDRQLPVLLRGSRYAERLPIGRTDVLDTFHHDRLRAFYRDWYRPDLMAVVAVGDFDGLEVERQIRERFTALVAPAAPRPRASFDVPAHDQTLFSIVSDPEASRLGASIYFKHPPRPNATADDYRTLLTVRLMTAMLNQRLHELTQKAEPPFMFGYSSYSGYTPAVDAFVLSAGLDEARMTEGISALVAEAERARRFGFTATELEREKTDLLRSYERAYAEREKTESSSIAAELVGHFTDAEAAPGIEAEYALVQQLLPTIALADVNRLPGALMTRTNRVIAITAPEKEGLVLPSPARLAALLDSAGSLALEAYEDIASTTTLLETLPTPGSITKEQVDRDLGLLRWTLSNGITVVLKPTDFKNDEILLSSFSPGGTSIVTDEDFLDASMATAVATEGGVGALSQIELQKTLAGRAVSAWPSIGELYEGLSGSASPRDVETMFQLLHLYVTSPRYDSTAFVSMRARAKTSLRNRDARPESAFSDTLTAILSRYHPRRRPWTEATYDRIDPQRAMAIYRERFADVSDLTMVIVGSFDPDTLRPLVERYVASLPGRGRRENWRDLGIVPPTGVVERVIRRGREPKARVQMVFSGELDWSQTAQNELYAMSSVLEIMLRESLREEKGGTYGVGVAAVPTRRPRERYAMIVSFGCAPERLDELVGQTLATIDSLKREGPSRENLAKVTEAARRSNELNLRNNRYWLSQLQTQVMFDEPLGAFLAAPAEFEKLTVEQVRAAARRYLDPANLVKVVLLPETMPTDGQAEEGR